jgi:hypothetical protein
MWLHTNKFWSRHEYWAFEYRHKNLCYSGLRFNRYAIDQFQDSNLWPSGLKVNELKTKICAFHPKETLEREIKVIKVFVRSLSYMNLLGVLFDTKLDWIAHLSNAIKIALTLSTVSKLFFRQIIVYDDYLRFLLSPLLLL